MLIRIGGGKEGIKEYLEKGHKQGREFSRDELDERVILAGDLDFTDDLIKDLDTEGERYLHVTLAFKEDEIPREVMENIVRDFEQFAFAAYGRDEYNFYAEAHLPKIKSYVNQKTGETVERKPHIHFVVPKTNLLSGGSLNPFGLVEHNEKFIDAFQEHVNNKYGLASPKTNRRIEFTDASDMINRYKDDEFSGNNRDLKKEILSAVLERDITSYDEFKILLNDFGETRTRNAGKDGEYQNVKPIDNAKGVNLKEYVFSREFVELSADDKRDRLSSEVTRRYEIAGLNRTDSNTIQEGLDEWYSKRAAEIKYINSGNKQFFHRYKDADADTKALILAEQASNFYAKYKEPRHESEGFQRNPFNTVYGLKPIERERDEFSSRGTEQPAPGHAELGRATGQRTARPDGVDGRDDGRAAVNVQRGQSGTIEPGQGREEATRSETEGTGEQRQFLRLQYAFAAGRQYDPQAHPRISKATSINSLRTLSSLDVDGHNQRSALLLPHHAPQQLDDSGPTGALGVRRDRHSQRSSSVIAATGRRTDSRLSQRGRDLREDELITSSDEVDEFRTIRKNLDAHRLLADLSQSHGVIMDKYEVTQAPDGSARITCGTRKLNVSDFLTREMRLSWSESAGLLRESYARQEDLQPVRDGRTGPSTALWRQFQADRKRHGGQRALWTRQFASEKSRRDELKQERDRNKRAKGPLGVVGSKAQGSVAAMAHIAAERDLAATIRIERQQLRKPISEQYREFLRDMADSGSSPALIELRRMAKNSPPRDTVTGGSISAAAGGRQENGIFFKGRDVKYRVQVNGDVVYTLGGRAIIEDRGSKLMMLQTDRFAIETGLRLAEGKFGSTMILTGPRDFKERAAIVAAESGIAVTFQDKALEKIRSHRVAELVSERAEREYHRQLGKAYKPKVEADGKQAEPEKPKATQAPERGQSKDEAGKKQDRER